MTSACEMCFMRNEYGECPLHRNPVNGKSLQYFIRNCEDVQTRYLYDGSDWSIFDNLPQEERNTIKSVLTTQSFMEYRENLLSGNVSYF
jgi:hypothetical protein